MRWLLSLPPPCDGWWWWRMIWCVWTLLLLLVMTIARFLTCYVLRAMSSSILSIMKSHQQKQMRRGMEDSWRDTSPVSLRHHAWWLNWIDNSTSLYRESWYTLLPLEVINPSKLLFLLLLVKVSPTLDQKVRSITMHRMAFISSISATSLMNPFSSWPSFVLPLRRSRGIYWWT